MAATKTPAKPKTASKPTYNGLAVAVHFELSAEKAAAVAAYHANCCDFEASLAALFQKRETILAGALDATFRQVIGDGATLNQELRSLEDLLTHLRWNRVELLPELLPEFAAELAAAEAAYEKTVAEEMARFEAAGAGLAAMSCGHKHSKGAERQLRHRVMKEIPCLAAFGRLQTARAAMSAIAGQRHSVPSNKSCTLTWPSAADGITADIARLAGIA